MSYSSVVLADSPAGYWHLGETAGTNAADATANNDAGTYTNSSGYTLNQTSLVNSTADPSVKFIKASLGYVLVASATALNLADTFTMEAWIKLSALGQSTNKAICSKQNGAYLMRVNTSDKVEMLKSQTSSLAVMNSGALPTVGPHHIVCTKSGSTRVIYINGTSDTFLNANATCVDNSNRFLIGADGAANTPADYFDGWVDEVAIYPTALNSTQVTAHYNAGIAAQILANNPDPTASFLLITSGA